MKKVPPHKVIDTFQKGEWFWVSSSILLVLFAAGLTVICARAIIYAL